jgi:hypothetical protein
MRNNIYNPAIHSSIQDARCFFNLALNTLREPSTERMSDGKSFQIEEPLAPIENSPTFERLRMGKMRRESEPRVQLSETLRGTIGGIRPVRILNIKTQIEKRTKSGYGRMSRLAKIGAV